MSRTLVAVTLAALVFAGGRALAKRPDDPGGQGKPDRSSWGKARAPLVRPPVDAPDANAKGRIDVMARKNGSTLRIMGQRLDPGVVVDIVLVPLVGDEEVLADAVGADDEGSVKVQLRTRKGDALPGLAASIGDLAGAEIEIRLDDGGDDVLRGVVPAIGADLPRRVRARADLVPEDGQDCAGRIQIGFRGKDVRSELRIDVTGLTPGAAVSFRMDDGTTSVVEFATETADAEGEAHFRARTHHGDPMPFGVASVLDLAGRDVEVHVDDVLCLTGAVPSGE